jgi:hypothetical protein
MPIRAKLLLVAVWMISLVAVARWAGAQNRPAQPPLSQPLILSGSDLGFRVDSQIGGNRPDGSSSG